MGQPFPDHDLATPGGQRATLQILGERSLLFQYYFNTDSAIEDVEFKQVCDWLALNRIPYQWNWTSDSTCFIQATIVGSDREAEFRAKWLYLAERSWG